jgi:hypothetical protein
MHSSARISLHELCTFDLELARFMLDFILPHSTD